MTEHNLIVQRFTDLIFIVNKMFLTIANRLWSFSRTQNSVTTN